METVGENQLDENKIRMTTENSKLKLSMKTKGIYSWDAPKINNPDSVS
jgi:hypothetical protein